MLFVDGENLAMRYGDMLSEASPLSHVECERDVFVWSPVLNRLRTGWFDVVRRHYYTSARGDEDRRQEIHEKLQALGFGAPRVFHRSKGKGSKRVDISLSVEMLSHAHRGNYDLAVLVAGDEDFAPPG
jgi:hypothetical protein